MEIVLHEAIKEYLHFVFDRAWMDQLAKNLGHVQDEYVLKNPRVRKIEIRIVENPIVPGRIDLNCGNIVAHFVLVKGVRNADYTLPM